ncbi:gametocyte surface protein P230-like, partial [Clytia hemisphaerica]|uniref:gametocyte surface protein P230-like n=1 Tax=Clytia hemisphaerica TaxID=252671 RepID=UPI0034D59B58
FAEPNFLSFGSCITQTYCDKQRVQNHEIKRLKNSHVGRNYRKLIEKSHGFDLDEDGEQSENENGDGVEEEGDEKGDEKGDGSDEDEDEERDQSNEEEKLEEGDEKGDGGDEDEDEKGDQSNEEEKVEEGDEKGDGSDEFDDEKADQSNEEEQVEEGDEKGDQSDEFEDEKGDQSNEEEQVEVDEKGDGSDEFEDEKGDQSNEEEQVEVDEKGDESDEEDQEEDEARFGDLMNAVVLDDKEGYHEHRRSFAIDLIKSVVTNITKESIDLVFPRNKTPSGKIKKMTQLNTEGRKSPHSIIEEESEDPQDVSFFNEVGLDHSTAESLANKKLTKTKFFTRDFHGKKASYMITPEFRKIPIICDQKTLKRRRGGNWVDITLKLIKEANPFCSWKFTYNHIRKNKTNKKNSSYWVAKAKCTFVDCNCRVEITQEDKESLELVFHFIGDINHDVTKPKSTKINGEARKQVKSKLS